MPLIRTENKLILYCHIPKCGGTTVTSYFKDVGLPVGFVSTSFKGQKVKWSKTSPQHIEMQAVKSLNLEPLIDLSFTLVRHPTSRFVSAFHYNKKNGKIPFWMTLNMFLTRLECSDDEWHYQLDNHFRPMSHFVGETTKFHIFVNYSFEIVDNFHLCF